MGSWPAFFLRLFYYYYYYYLYHSRNGEPTLPVHQWAFAIRNEQGFAFLPLLPPLVNLLINNDCKPDNAVFAIFILLPLSLHATPSTLSLYTYVYIYSIDFHSKTTFTSRSKIAHYPFRLNSPNSSAFRQNKENLWRRVQFYKLSLVHGREFIEI